MSLPPDVQHTVPGAQRAYYEDGLPDMAFGCAFVLFSLAFLGSGGRGTFMIYVILLLPVLMAAMQRLKQRYTYPRTGLVRSPQQGLRSAGSTVAAYVLLGLASTLAILLLTGSLHSPEQWYRWAPVFSGILLAGALHHLASRSGFVRYHLLTIACLLSAVLLSVHQFPGRLQGLGFHILLQGLLLLLFGAVTFARFLRRYPPSGTLRSAAEGAAERPRSAVEGAAERPRSAVEGAAERPRSAAEGTADGLLQSGMDVHNREEDIADGRG